MSSEIPHVLPETSTTVSNDQRHDAALTVAEMYEDCPEDAVYVLVVLGLAYEDSDGSFRSLGCDEYEQPWFTKRVA